MSHHLARYFVARLMTHCRKTAGRANVKFFYQAPIAKGHRLKNFEIRTVPRPAVLRPKFYKNWTQHKTEKCRFNPCFKSLYIEHMKLIYEFHLKTYISFFYYYINKLSYNVINEFEILPRISSEKFHWKIEIDENFLRIFPLKTNSNRLTSIFHVIISIIDRS